jgi:hypothetical protein
LLNVHGLAPLFDHSLHLIVKVAAAIHIPWSDAVLAALTPAEARIVPAIFAWVGFIASDT